MSPRDLNYDGVRMFANVPWWSRTFVLMVDLSEMHVKISFGRRYGRSSVPVTEIGAAESRDRTSPLQTISCTQIF